MKYPSHCKELLKKYMKERILCDNCKKEYEAENDDVDGLGELRCPDCKEDLQVLE